jgi:hypothetical protein
VVRVKDGTHFMDTVQELVHRTGKQCLLQVLSVVIICHMAVITLFSFAQT